MDNLWTLAALRSSGLKTAPRLKTVTPPAIIWRGGWMGFLCVLFALSGCTSTPEPSAETSTPSAVERPYTKNSWKTRIPSSCQSFSDGCNTCSRNPETGMAACTRKACATYSKPECLDEMKDDTVKTAESTSKAAESTSKTTAYQCDQGNRFVVSYGLYIAGDQRVRLKEDQVMFSDRQTKTASLLTRVVSASGARYQGGGLDFWEKGSEAMVRKDEEPLYLNCVPQ